MAIEKVIEIKLSAKEAEKNLTAINKTLEEQREILILLEKELLDVQDAQNKTSKTNLAAQKQLTTQSNHLKSAIKDQKLGLKSLNIERREAADVLAGLNKGSKDNTNIIRAADKLTGGYATKILKLKKGFLSSIKVVKGFVAGLSGVKKALVATGIGALVVGLGLVVAYWKDIIALFDDGSKKLQKQADEHRKNISLSEDQLALLNNQEKILKLQGKSTKEVVEQKKKVLILQQEENRLLLENLKTQLLREQQQQTELTFWEKTKVAVADAVGGAGAAAIANAKTFKKTAEEIEKLDDLEKQIQDTKINGQKLTLSLLQLDEKQKKKKAQDVKDFEALEREKQEALERIRKGGIDTEEERRAEELFQVQEQYRKLIEEADKYNQSTTELIEAQGVKEQELKDKFAQQDKDRKDKADKEAAEKKLEAAEKKLEEDKKIADSEIALEQQKTAAKRKALDDAISLAGAETGVGKALLIVKQGLALKEMIMEAKKTIAFSKLAVAKSTVAAAEGTAQTAKIGFPQNIPMLIGYAAQAVGIIGAIRSATSSANSISGSFGGGGGASVPAAAPSIPTAESLPPSFNVVGATETSVLSDAVAGQTNQPVQAYVVANDVTTAQSLENNIVEGATI